MSTQSRLAEALQTARDLVFPVATLPEAAVLAGIVSRLTELREIVLTSRLDLDRLGHDAAARFVRARLGVVLRELAAPLDELKQALLFGTPPSVSTLRIVEQATGWSEAERLLQGDERARLIPLIASRLRYLAEEVDAISGLLRGGEARHSLAPAELSHYVADDDTWPLAALTAELSIASPVFRHAARSALARAPNNASLASAPTTRSAHFPKPSAAALPNPPVSGRRVASCSQPSITLNV